MHELLPHPPANSVGPPRYLAGGRAALRADQFQPAPPDPGLETGDRQAENDPLPRELVFDSAERNACLREAAERLSAALFHVIHQPTSKGRDRSLAALVALIYGPTPFGGVNNLRDVAMRYGITEQNLFQLMRGHRELLARSVAPEYEI